LLIIFDRVAAYENKTGKQKRGTKVLLNFIMKNMYQALYFFMLPFFWEASVLNSLNIGFTLLLGILAVLSTQDLIFDNWLMENKILRATYYTLCLFASFDLLLPLFIPIPTRYILPLAAFLSVFGFIALHYPKLIFKKGKLRWIIISGLVIGYGCHQAEILVPAAPYKISQTAITAVTPDQFQKSPFAGVRKIHENDFKKKKLYCINILETPMYPRDTFTHIWSRNGETLLKKDVKKLKLGNGDYLLWTSMEYSNLSTIKTLGNWHVELSTGGRRLLNNHYFMVVN
nr:DUF5924 family protein [Deltaproteobacteria bacterium]